MYGKLEPNILYCFNDGHHVRARGHVFLLPREAARHHLVKANTSKRKETVTRCNRKHKKKVLPVSERKIMTMLMASMKTR